MSLKRMFVLFGATAALIDSGFAQNFVRANFDQLAAPKACLGNFSPSAPVPDLKLPGMTLSGGQLLFDGTRVVYATYSGCAGVKPTLTITFEGTASNVFFDLNPVVVRGTTVQITDNSGFHSTMTAGIRYNTVQDSNSNIRQITIAAAGSSYGFSISNLYTYNLANSIYFYSPVPLLTSGTGLTRDAQTLASPGARMLRAICADGTARILVAYPAHFVGEEITFRVINDRGVPSTSVPDDGAVSAGAGAQGDRSVKVVAQASSNGPIAFAIYHPPASFSRGGLHDNVATRTVNIEADSSAPHTPAVSRPLTILRSPVILVNDPSSERSIWDSFRSFVLARITNLINHSTATHAA